MNEDGNRPNSPVPPQEWGAGNTAQMPQQEAQPTVAQPVYAQPVAAAAPQSAKQPSGAKTFLLGFAGAALACVIAVGALFATGTLGGSSSTTTLGSSGSGTTITVNGEDTTLAEAVSQKCLPSVVNIDVYTKQQTQSFYGLMGQDTSSSTLEESSLGSGIILSEDGYILTNYHVIEDADQLKVTANSQEYEAKVVGTDESSDLAVLKIDATGLTAIEIGSSSDLVVGEWVMALGSPFGLEQSVSTGIVSATSRTTSSLTSSESSAVYTNMIQTDAAINPGNSGGALVDSDGKLIGINTLIASSSGSSSGVGFAIPVDYAMGIAQQIMNGETPSHAQLGVSCTTINSQLASRYNLPVDSGAYVSQLSSGSAAANAGIQQGDIITKVGDTSISSSTDLILAIRSHSVGDTVSITYNRNGTETTVDVTLGSDS